MGRKHLDGKGQLTMKSSLYLNHLLIAFLVPLLICSPLAAQQAAVGVSRNYNGIVRNGLLGEYKMVDCSGTNCPDSSGSGNAGTLVNTPTIGATGVTFTFSSSNRMQTSVPANSTISVIVVADSAYTTDNQWHALFGSDVSGEFGAYGSTSTNNGTFPSTTSISSIRNVNGTVQTAESAWPGPTMYGYVLDASADKVYFNGKKVTSFTATAGNLAESRTGNMRIASANGLFMTGTVYYALLYSRALTDADMYQNFQALSAIMSGRGVPLAPTPALTGNTLIFEGDSITERPGATGQGGANSFPGQVSGLLETFTNTFNFGVSGEKVSTMIAAAPNKIIPLIQSNPNALNVCVIQGGTNDAVSAQATYELKRGHALMLRAAGCKVVMVDLMSSQSGDTTKDTVNALIRANWPEFADALADVGADPDMGCTNCYQNTVYFDDGVIHPSVVGNGIIAKIVAKAINSIGNANQAGCITRNITSADRRFNVAATSADIQVTLPQQYSKIIGTTVKHSTAFAGTGLTSLTVSLGDSTSNTAYTGTFDIFQAVATTTFQDTALFKSTTMAATPPVINAHFIANTNLGKASQTITAVTNANPAQMTSTGHGFSNSDHVYITGFTGNWLPANGTWVISNVAANTFTIPVDSTGFGAISGSPVFTGNFLTAGSVDLTVCSIPSTQ